ncbi:MAG: septation protein SpoVG family protein [Candidatus Omnitrophota bacterium]|nr:septation protein SpoVG family protein [Candidatus Omnitrophota bacterium]MDZ4242409.1 septation protein SpoVG family protein [Candidatus Omnitrophota bacterium]
MQITEIRVFLKEGQDKKLKAYTTVTFDNEFVVRNIKVIQGSTGMFIAMPSRKLKVPCPKCRFKNELGGKFCSQCGASLPVHTEDSLQKDAKAEHRDIAHPITQRFREYIQTEILGAYKKELEHHPHGTSQSGGFHEGDD